MNYEYILPRWQIRSKISEYLKEDIPFWDVSLVAIPSHQEVEAEILAKASGIIAGLPVAEEIFNYLGCQVEYLVEEGAFITTTHTPVMNISGTADKILSGERLTLNFLGRMSGIATQTYKASEILQKTDLPAGIIRPVIAATRKTTPGFRLFEKYAVVVGGGDTHRFSLSDCIMLKDNHLKFFPSIQAAITETKKHISLEHKIEVEAATSAQAVEAVNAGVDILMMDNFSAAELQELVPRLRKINPDVVIEASGSIRLNNLEKYAVTGVDIISSGSLTHSVPNFDISLKVK